MLDEYFNEKNPERSELGKNSDYDPYYNPNKLFSIPRKTKRDEIGVSDGLPFFGYDIWNHYEVSWLTNRGKPIVALAKIVYSCDSPNIIESKSMKLYFNSLNNTKFESLEMVQETIRKDIERYAEAPVSVELKILNEIQEVEVLSGFSAINIDNLDIECSDYMVNPHFLTTENTLTEEKLCSDLLKSNCLVTHQPDWGSVLIEYKGKKINRSGLLRYIVSFRNHNEFHEQCIERIFIDIMRYCQPQELTVYGRYTRRGGLDINPYRSTNDIEAPPNNFRLIRQ